MLRHLAYQRTPPPVYQPDDAPIGRPERLAVHDTLRMRTAAVHARTRYPGVVGDILADHLTFHADSGWAGDPTGQAARLVEHLMSQP